jgi:hypothetical protein
MPARIITAAASVWDSLPTGTRGQGFVSVMVAGGVGAGRRVEEHSRMEKDKQVSFRRGNALNAGTRNQEHYFRLSVTLGLTTPLDPCVDSSLPLCPSLPLI